MSVTQTRNVDYVLVGNDGATTPPANSIQDLAEGQIGVFNAYGNTGAVAADASFIIAIGGANGKPAFVSEAISPTKVTVSKARGPETAKEQKDCIGFNGTSGSIDSADLIANNLYMVDVMIQEYLTSNTDGRYIKHFQYQSGSLTPTSVEVTHNLTKSGVLNFSREAEDYMHFSHLINDGGVNPTGTVANFSFIKGSNTVAYGNPGASLTNVNVGDYIRQGGAGAADPVYKITAIDTTNQVITLDYPFQEDNAFVLTASVYIISAATAATSDTGLCMEGLPLSFVVGKEQYKKVRWELVLNGFDVTVASRERTADRGLGTYEQASEAEWFARGFEGEYHRMGEPTIYPFRGNAASGTAYDVTTIRWVDDEATSFQADVSPKQITIYSPNGVDYMVDAAADNGVWANIEAAMVNNTGKMSHRDTGDANDTQGSLAL
jgi:hypothetical protein